jgi:hypothetical protein
MKRHLTLLLLAAVVLTASCSEILGFRTEGPRPFEHREHVTRGINCNACHPGAAAAGDDGPLHLPTTADCVSCHQKPHDSSTCSNCHGLPSTRRSAMVAREDLRFQHKTHVPRLKGDCVRCHVDVEQGNGVLRPRMAVCGSCHQHQEQLAKNSCDPCHVNLHEEDTKPDDHLIHSGNFVREHGVRAAADKQVCSSCHAERFCSSCHGVTVPILPERLRFDDPMRAGVHRAGFKSRHALEAKNDPGLCTTCHQPSTCSSCHEKNKLTATGGGRSPHPSGWLGLPGQRNEHGRAAWREPEQCASCHGGAGEMLCVGCHKVGAIGGNPHSASFKSRKQPKTDRPCRLCHGVGP